jgi:large subunit ribosomal protein L18
MATLNRKRVRSRIRFRIRKKIAGTAERPRLAVSFSGRHVYAQVIDDTQGKTLVSANTTEKGFLAEGSAAHANSATAEKIGKLLAERALGKQIKAVVFDRGGFKYHGKVKTLADAARAGGLEF